MKTMPFCSRIIHITGFLTLSVFLIFNVACNKSTPTRTSVYYQKAVINDPGTVITHNDLKESHDTDISIYSFYDSSLIVPLKSGDKLLFLLSDFICNMNDSMRSANRPACFYITMNDTFLGKGFFKSECKEIRSVNFNGSAVNPADNKTHTFQVSIVHS